MVIALLAGSSIAGAYAQVVWTGNGADNNWSTPANWQNGIAPTPGMTTLLRFEGFEVPERRAAVVDRDSPWVLNGLTFATNFSLSGNQLSFQGTAPSIVAFMSNGTPVIANDIAIPQGQLSLSGIITLTGEVSGGGGLDVTHAVTLKNANSYTGVTRVGLVRRSTLTVTHPQALGSVASGTTVAWGSALELRGGITVAGEPLSLNGDGWGSGLVNGAGNNTWSGDITLGERGALASYTAGDRLTVTGAVIGGGGSLSFDGEGDIEVTGSITNLAGFGISKSGKGTVTLSGSNTGFSTVGVRGGALVLASAGALPADAYVTLSASANTSYPAVAGTLRVLQDSVIGGLSGSTGDPTSVLDLTSANLIVNSTAYSSGFVGRLVGSGSLIKQGPGTFSFQTAADYSAQLIVEAGVLRMGFEGAFGPVTGQEREVVTLNGGALQAYNPYIPVSVHPSHVIRLGERGGALESQLPASNIFVVGGRLTGPGRLTKRGHATVALSNPANDYSGGTTIESGVLRFDHPGAIGGTGGNVLIGSSATATTAYELDQTLLDRIDPASAGMVALSGPSGRLLDFDTPGLKYVFLGAIGNQAFHGAIRGFEDIVRLTGARGSLTLTGPQALAGTRFLEVGNVPDGWVAIANDNVFPGTAWVRAGTLWIGSFTFSCNEVAVRQGAALRLWQTQLTAGTIVIDEGAVLEGCGTITAEVINHGTIIASCGELRFTAPLTNYGQITLRGDATLASTAAVTNHGLVDLLTSRNATLPEGFVNHGRIIGFGEVKIHSTEKIKSVFQMRVESISGHRYWMQRSLSLSSPVWENVGWSRDGITGQDIYLFENTAPASQAFYRIVVDP